MTVIAFDGRMLAADRRSVDGAGIARTVTKIERYRKHLLAITGNCDVGCETREWWKAGADPVKFPAKSRDGEASLIVISPDGGIYTYGTGPYPLHIEQEKCAFGSGRDFAEAAMYRGKNAAQAVEIACLFQSDCGNGVTVLELES